MPPALPPAMTSTSQLEHWISESRAHRQQLKVALTFFTLLSLLVYLPSHAAGLVMLFVDATIAVCGFWILSGHIADWEGQLARRRTT